LRQFQQNRIVTLAGLHFAPPVLGDWLHSGQITGIDHDQSPNAPHATLNHRLRESPLHRCVGMSTDNIINRRRRPRSWVSSSRSASRAHSDHGRGMRLVAINRLPSAPLTRCVRRRSAALRLRMPPPPQGWQNPQSVCWSPRANPLW
jgi:hypothetical protein